MRRSRARLVLLPPSVIAFVAVALLAIALQGATVPHTHEASGLYNFDHDLTIFAALGGGAPLPGTSAALPIDPTVTPLAARDESATDSAPRHHPASRAPPVR
jgi:hypothetical protein